MSSIHTEVAAINNDATFTDCMVLDVDSFDPDAVFLEDIVEDDVLPSLSLAVDGLTGSGSAEKRRCNLDVRDPSAEVIEPSSVLPDAAYDPEQLEVYGWESSFWRKVRGYLGF